MQPDAQDTDTHVCTCRTEKAASFVQAARNGCLRCCKRYIHEAGKIVNGTTALIEAIKNGYALVSRLLLSAEGHLTDENGKTALYHAAMGTSEMFNGILKTAEPGFYVTIRKMREMACICSKPSKSIRKCIEKRCMRCTASQIQQAYKCIEEVINSVRAAENPHLAPVKLMVFLQEKFEIRNGATELIFAIQNNRYEAVAALVGEQRDLKDANGWKASGYAASVHNPKLWALFPKDIDKEYAADLWGSHQTKCVCNGYSWDLKDALSSGCLHCCARFVYQAEMPDSAHMEVRRAIKIKRPDLVRLLRHVQTGFSDKDDITGLMFAAKHGDTESTSLLAEREARLQNKDGTTALMIAARHCKTANAQCLIPFEARMQDAFGRTALMHAIKFKHHQLVLMLFPYERDIKDYEGQGPEDYAANANDPTFWKHFDSDAMFERNILQEPEDWLASLCHLKCKNLIMAARAGCVDCCKKFIGEARVKVNGRTALMEAAVKGHDDVVRLLANPEAGIQDAAGNTALILAAQKGHQEVVRLLIPREAGMVSIVNRTALIQAVKNFHGNCVSLLKQSPNELRASGIQRVMFAAYDGDLQAVLQNRQQWGSLFRSGFNVLNFALLRGRSSYIRAITRDHESRQQLACGVILPQSSGISILEMAVHFNVKWWHLRQILDVVCATQQGNRSVIATMALFSFYNDWPAIIWRHFCTPGIKDLRYVLGRVSDGFRIMRGCRWLKNVGVLQNITFPDLKDSKASNHVKKYLTQNPIKSKQWMLAQQQASKEVPEERAFAWRETEAEAAFNRSIVLECREAVCTAFPKARSSPVPPIPNRCAAKLEANAALIYGAYFYAYGVM